MISKNGSYTSNKLAGVVMVTDNPVVLDNIGKFIDMVNTEAGENNYPVKLRLLKLP